MKYWIGKSIILIGVIHTTFGFIFFKDYLLVWVQEGLFNTVNAQPDREAVYWFLFFGVFLMLFGRLIWWCHKNSIGLPSNLKWTLLGIIALMLFIMPFSGAWLMLIPIGGMFWKKGMN